MADKKNYITPAGFQRLKDEYQKLFHEERPATVKVVAWAASLGDRSENADYIYNKRKLREIDRRLKFLIDRLDIAVVVDPKEIKSESIVFGATVTIESEDGVQKTYQIVGEDEINVAEGKISWKSPLAKALLNKKLGDEIVIKKPAGDDYAEIVALKYL